MYYCFDCSRQCSTMEVDEVFADEFWGSIQYVTKTYLMCELCGSYSVEEIVDEENKL